MLSRRLAVLSRGVGTRRDRNKISRCVSVVPTCLCTTRDYARSMSMHANPQRLRVVLWFNNQLARRRRRRRCDALTADIKPDAIRTVIIEWLRRCDDVYFHAGIRWECAQIRWYKNNYVNAFWLHTTHDSRSTLRHARPDGVVVGAVLLICTSQHATYSSITSSRRQDAATHNQTAVWRRSRTRAA